MSARNPPSSCDRAGPPGPGRERDGICALNSPSHARKMEAVAANSRADALVPGARPPASGWTRP
jgi:hypothetical protein